jgi:S-adenosylmethionine/arginine decarboxylase-like enzyme
MNKVHFPDDTIFGYHAIINARDCCPVCIDNEKIIIEWLYELLQVINMELHGIPWLERFGSTDDIAGYTLLAMITTSNIACHFVPKHKKCYIDVFSCRQFDIKKVLEVTNKYFKNKSENHRFIIRE